MSEKPKMDEADKVRATELQEEYMRLSHAMQTGVKFEMETGITDAHLPKHLRVGVNMALADAGALARLLLQKGVFTALEYYQMLVTVLEEEVARYTIRIERATGHKVTLA